MNVTKNLKHLEKILPHKDKMVLIDDVILVDLEKKCLTAVVTISPESLFFDKEINGISGIIGLEYMAQTVGCYAYYKNGEKEPQKGLLLGTRLYNVSCDFEAGKTYTINVREIFFDNNMVSFECMIYNDRNEEIQSATVNVYQNYEGEDFENE